MGKIISGIQQIGIGVPDLHKAWKWYRIAFGMDIRMFEESAEAPLMIDYTGGKVQSRNAALAVNMQGGGGFEIWQYTSRVPKLPDFEISLGDYGIFACKIKCRDVKATFNNFKNKGFEIIGKLNKAPDHSEHFFVKDPYGSVFQIVKGGEWFLKNKVFTGGVDGCIIGVSSIETAKSLYCKILEYDTIVYDKEGFFEDFTALPGGNEKCRRILLERSKPAAGSFSRFLGSGKIELVQVYHKKPRKIFENRYWGDRGFIHLCFDVKGMQALQKECAEKGFPFVVDSRDVFEMGEASGHFSYIEDQDGTLIEFVETHKIPLIKKLGWYLPVSNKNPGKPLPKWILRMLVFNRVKD